MKFLLVFLISAFALGAAENEKIVLAASPAGCVVLLKEHYGGTFRDTGTVVMIYNSAVWVTHRQRGTSVYPFGNYSIISVEKLSPPASAPGS